MTHAGHAWAPTGTPGRCLEGVTPGSAGIFSALSYFVAETPIIFNFSKYFIPVNGLIGAAFEPLLVVEDDGQLEAHPALGLGPATL